MIRAYKFLMRPTVGQQAALAAMLADHCSLYNGALQERRDAYRHTSKTLIKYGQQSAQLKEIRSFDPESGPLVILQPAGDTTPPGKAFAAFFRRAKAGETPGYPRFRGVNWFDTVDFPKDGDGCRWDSTARDRVPRVRLQGVGHVKVNQHRPVAGRVKTVSVKREGKRWYVVLTAEQAQPEPLPKTDSVIGIDMGIAHFLADSSGEFVPNPRHGRRAAAKLEAAQQALARFPRVRRDKRTANHRRAVDKVAALHRKVRRQPPLTRLALRNFTRERPAGPRTMNSSICRQLVTGQLTHAAWLRPGPRPRAGPHRQGRRLFGEPEAGNATDLTGDEAAAHSWRMGHGLPTTMPPSCRTQTDDQISSRSLRRGS